MDKPETLFHKYPLLYCLRIPEYRHASQNILVFSMSYGLINVLSPVQPGFSLPTVVWHRGHYEMTLSTGEKIMKYTTIVAITFGLVGLTSTAVHADGLALATKSGCMGCHTIETKRVGPAWNDVSEKYKGNEHANHMIVETIQNGSKGKWGGAMPMPAQKHVSAEDASTLANFIIGLKK